MKFLDKFISYKLEYNKIVKTINIFGLKIKHSYYNYLCNEKLCSKVDIKTLLFTRADGIGDFIMDIPYIRYIKQSKRFEGYKIILAVSQNIMDLAKKYVNKYVDGYYLIERWNVKDVKKNEFFIKKFKKMSFTTILNPADGKENYGLEELVKYADAKEKIGHYGFFSRFDISLKETNKQALNSYTQLIDTGEELMLVKDRCKIFFEELLGEKIPYVEKLSELDIPKDYVLVSPFSRGKTRTYSAQNYIKIIDYINSELNLPVLIVGARNEWKKAQGIKNKCQNSNMVYNIAGNKNFSEKVLYIKNAKLMVANETGTVHLAQNYGVRTVCISNGGFLGTFWPYPEEESVVSYIYPENIEEYLTENNRHGYSIKYDINTIDCQKVISKISEVMKQENKVPSLV